MIIWRENTRMVCCLFREANSFLEKTESWAHSNSFPRAKVSQNCELRGTDNVLGQIGSPLFRLGTERRKFP